MPPSAKTEKDDEFSQGEGFPAYNTSRRRQPPPKLKKPVPHYRHLIRWNKNQIPDSIEEQQLNQDLAILRHALDLFLNSNMAECEAILAKGPIPVTEHRVNGGGHTSNGSTSTATQKAAEALSGLKLQDDKKAEGDDFSSVNSSSVPSIKDAKRSDSSASSTTDGKKDSKDKEPRAMYYDLGKAIIQGLRALVTFDPNEIDLGMKAFEQAIKTANKQRKGSMIGLGSVKAVGSFVVGTIGAGSFRSMNRVQKHAELIYAEATILRSLLSVLYHLDVWMVVEECINLRHAFTIIQGLKSFMDSVESELRAGKNIDRHQIDEHLVSGVTLSYSLYNIVISFMPEVIVKMLQFIGFPSDRDWGMAMLGACGDWDPMAPPETPAERAERLASSANDGIRRQFCDMIPVIFQVIISSFIPMNHIDLNYAQTINDYNLELYPESPFFLFFKGRHLQVTSKLDEAVATYHSAKVQPHWHNLTHIFVFEEMMCAMMQTDHDTACEKSRQLLKESRWSKCAFRYLTAITGYERGKQSEKKKIDSLMAKVEDGMQKVAGMNLFFETFCARKSKRYIKEGHLLLPNYDFMLLWNTFDMMPPKVLQVALTNISTEVRRLQAMLPEKMKSREDQPLAAKDQTIEASAGRYLSGMFSNKNQILKDSNVADYENFYDDYCLAFFLQGLVAYHIAFFPEEAFNREMCELALESFQTVFRYAPLIKDDTYTYYFSHYYKAKVWIHQGRLDEAQTRFKYLLGLSNTNLLGLPALVGGKGRNSLELFVLLKVHSGMLDIETARAAAAGGDGGLKESGIYAGSIQSDK
ncbi:hypothetical protein BC939DRAFT_503364 [Gamsiella multidivaricata]|uniref:uncharacterized protein n=1 Tax=Gamsiella multidivaricata TaxID=101098 RepID=UPI00221EB5C0|nr:uncharacterized protein BC939DRAFT_503364 [Gamsiella multidivaricata]KAG0368555.1 hypothetical protein BGZ54_001685 [Gamsiella multidivaricata]KAI7823203.1 hypothetical protein BC939DRAFT_503364 [Gamsiella multidivaricata]